MRLGLVWFVVVVVGLSFASFKRSDYLLPAYPGAALFIACVLDRWRQEATGRLKPIAARVPLLLVFVVACVTAGWLVRVCYSLPKDEPHRDYTKFAAVIRRQAPAPREIVFFRTEAHALAFHVGRPLETMTDWSELNARLTQNGPHYVVLPFDALKEAHHELRGVCWEEVENNVELSGGRLERPLALVRAE